MICPNCDGPLTPFGHGYAECAEGCGNVYIVAGGSYRDGWELVHLAHGLNGSRCWCTDGVPPHPPHAFDTVPPEPTVKRATLFDGVVDTYQTETELNGWKPRQGALL